MKAVTACLLGVFAVCFPYAIADVNNLAMVTVLNSGLTTCDPEEVVLDSTTQGSLCEFSLRPVNEDGSPASFVVTARFKVDKNQPTIPDAPGQTGKVETTTQNHGFVVIEDSLPKGVTATHLSLFDGTLEGFKLEGRPVFAVQYHPEASPGPQDSHYLFERFVEMMASDA